MKRFCRVLHNAPILLLSGIFICTFFLSSCAFLSNSSTEKSYGQWNIRAGEQVFMRDSTGITRSFRAESDILALLYRVDDTLFYHAPTLFPTKNFRQVPLLFAHDEVGLRANAVESDTVHFRDSHFDIDLMTIPFRYRFRQGTTLPPSAVASPFCGGIYAGVRINAASHHVQLLENQTLRTFTTNGFGFGAFVALAPLYVSPWNTDYRTIVEYEGLGVNYGGSLIWAYQGLTIGLLLGFELLADENSAIWVYHNKPWIGFSLGFNLN